MELDSNSYWSSKLCVWIGVGCVWRYSCRRCCWRKCVHFDSAKFYWICPAHFCVSDDYAGSALIYHLTANNSWVHQQTLTANDTHAFFGSAIVVGAGFIAASAPSAGGNVGLDGIILLISFSLLHRSSPRCRVDFHHD